MTRHDPYRQYQSNGIAPQSLRRMAFALLLVVAAVLSHAADQLIAQGIR